MKRFQLDTPFELNSRVSFIFGIKLFKQQSNYKKMSLPHKKIKLTVIYEILPEEILVMIFKKLDYKSLGLAHKTCKKWRNLIEGFNLFSLRNFSKFQNLI